jgi:CxxC motif-containing protein (DUF1111 family)
MDTVRRVGFRVVVLASLLLAAEASAGSLTRGLHGEGGLFRLGLEQFKHVWTVGEGLGPRFNATSCVACHNQPDTGGSGEALVTLFGREDAGVFDPLIEDGGPVLQEHGLDLFTRCKIPGETVPPRATIVAKRQTPPLFGLGLVSEIRDRRILRRADPTDRDHDGVSGRPNMVSGRVGRLGWKANEYALYNFVPAALHIELGVTSLGQRASRAERQLLAACDLPQESSFGEAQGYVLQFVTRLRPLAPIRSSRATHAGRAVFRKIGCATCHVEQLVAGPSPHGVLTLPEAVRVPLFSDLLLHDMGPELADGIVEGDATGSEFRTAPLWGLGRTGPYLHDGRSATVEDAVAAHGGEAEGARSRFFALPNTDRAALLAFLLSL